MENSKALQKRNELPNNGKHTKRIIKKKALPIKLVLFVFIIALITAAAVTAGVKTTPEYNPDKILKQYIHAVSNEDWGTVYDVMTINGSLLIPKEAFVNYCTENPTAMCLTSSPLTDFEIDEYNNTEAEHFFSISCLAEDKSTKTILAAVEKVGNGFMGLDKYAVQPFADCIVSFSFFAADGTTLYVDGTALAADLQTGTDPIYNTEYTYNRYDAYLLFGNYKISAVNPYCDNTEQDLTVDGNTSQMHIEQKINESSFNNLCNIAGTALAKLYDGVIHNNVDKTALPLSAAFSEEEFDALIRSVSEELYQSNESYNITGFEITSIVPKGGSDSTLGTEGCARADIPLTFDYNYTAESTNYLGSAFSEKKSDSGYSTVQLVLENGEWKINSITQRAWF